MDDSVAATIRWTEEQRLAIETAGRSLLVSAAAGSGKTAVLAERCAYLVCDAPEPHRCDVDELLVVTFTKAAAAEMKSRIEQAMRQRSRGRGREDRRLTQQLMLLDRAHISTIDSFCSNVLRRHFNLVGLDPNFRTLDAEEAHLLRLETARQLLADRYETDTIGQFQKLVDHYADGDDERLLGRIVSAHGMLSSVVDPKGWLQKARARISEAARTAPADSELGRELAALVQRRISEFRTRCIEACIQFETNPDFACYVDFLSDIIAAVDGFAEEFARGGFDAVAKAVPAFAEPELPRVPEAIPGKKSAKDLLDSLRDELKLKGKLYELCRFTSRDWQDGMQRTLPSVDVLIELITDFTTRYDEAKRELGALDFADLERLTLSVLRATSDDGGILAPSSTARAYHAQFKYVLVDEYQDINEVQDAILSLVSRECVCGQDGAIQNLFCVGDVKQSIYRFRLADPQRFLQRNQRLRTCNDERIGGVIDLQKNFRSRGPLLEAVNCVFERLMTDVAAEINYDETHKLREGAVYPKEEKTSFKGAPIELHLLPPPTSGGDSESSEADDGDWDLDRTQREASVVAKRIRELIEGDCRAQVADGSSLRPIQYRDIVILLRAARRKAEQFADMLRAAGIPVHSDGGSGFFDSMEIRDMLALLSVLDNRQQDIPLAAVLRSPLSGLAEPDDAMARVRLKYPANHDDFIPFHRAVALYASEQHDELAAHLRDFLEQIDQWRALAHQRPLAELIWTIYDSTGYLAFCTGLHDGEQRVANLVQLHERARQFGSFQRQGLRRFLHFLESLRDEQDLAQPSTASEAEDAVRVMSIHRSKGLEFPVVIVPDLARRHNVDENTSWILLDRDAGLGLLCVDEERRIRYPSMSSVLVQERIRRQSLAEEMRVLYVAMTRAREHLILVGTCKPEQVEKWQQRWRDHEGPIPADHVLRGACLLDWIGPVAAATGAMKDLPIQIIVHSDEEMRDVATTAPMRSRLTDFQQCLARLEPLAPAPHDDQDSLRVRQRLMSKYPHEMFTRLPASQSVGAMTKLGRAAFGGESESRERIVRFTRELSAPRCATESLSPSPLDIGSATHLVLQYLDFTRPCSRDDLKLQIRQMIERKLVPPAEPDHVDLNAIEWLLTTPLGALLREHAKTLRRELRIAYPQDVQGASSDPLDRVMLRGRIDVMIPTNSGLLLIDYKTDRVTNKTLDQRAAFYRDQLKSYSTALAGITGQPVRSAHLVFLHARQIVDVVTLHGISTHV